jgi:di/tricarboxylate transporter
MALTTAALVSIVALAIVVIISCVKEMNVGILGIAFALIVGLTFAKMKIAAVFAGWPLSLFMILVGVTFMFACAQVNGTMEKFTAYAVRLAKGNTALIPFILFILVTIITTIGPGNIATTALMAPVAMAIAGRIGLSAFAMTLLVVGAANGAAFSPFAPTGIISNGIIAKMAPELGLTDLNSLAWKVHFNSEIAQGIVNFGGFIIFGGLAWIRRQSGSAGVNIDEIAPKPEPFSGKQWITLAGIAFLVLTVILLKWDVGATAFCIGAVFMLLGAADDAKAIKAMPWGVIVMVCGMSVLINVMDKAGGLNALVSLIGAISNPTTVNGVLGFITGIISAYSSSSGVVMPMFLPMVPGLIKEIGGGDPIALISSINIGSHLVDTSPLSTLGALCIACAAEHEDKAKLFRNLLIWGLAMSVVGALVCYVAFGILGL